MTAIIVTLAVLGIAFRVACRIAAAREAHRDCRGQHTLGYCPQTGRAAARGPRRPAGRPYRW